MSVDLTTVFCGLTFKNPLIIPAGIHGRDGKTIKEISHTGVSAICTKTIVAQPASDVLPCFTIVPAGMINSVFGSDKTSEYWFTEGIKQAREGEALVIANLAGFSPEQGAELALKAESAGAQMIILPTHCPHMGEILKAMFPTMDYQEPNLTDLAPMLKTVRLVKEAVSCPVVVKLSGTFAHITREWAEGVKDSGADGIACSDALGPALKLDIKTGRPVLGGPRGVGGLTGPAIMPITLRMVLDIALTVDLPIIGVGGVTTASDVIEYLMAGATLVGVCTAGHLKGPEHYAEIIKDLEKLLCGLDVSSPEEVRGLTLKKIEERKEKGQTAVTQKVVPTVNEKLCASCGRCEQACAFGAIRVDSAAQIDPDRCTGCGLCLSVCPAGAISQVYYD
jgi:dihydroorotate dehydrogenase subfamily 1